MENVDVRVVLVPSLKKFLKMCTAVILYRLSIRDFVNDKLKDF